MVGSRGSIDAALDRIYPTERDFRMGLQAGPGEDVPPLTEVVAYRAAAPAPHWHYITYGMSELDDKTAEDPALSGFGVEYTLRLVDASAAPPAWPIQLLRWLAKRVCDTRHPYDPGHSMNLPYAMLESYSPGVEGFAFFEDDTLHRIETPTGAVTFVQVVPLQRGEYQLMGAWDAYKVEAELRAQSGDLLWRSGRLGLLDSARAKEILAAVDREGSSQHIDFAELAPTPHEAVLDSVGVRVFEKFLRHRIAHDRGATVITPTGEIRLEPGEWHYASDARDTVVRVPAHQARVLADDIANAADGALVTRPGALTLRVDRRL